MKILFAGSGSKGNATLLLSGDTLIEIDAGITKKRINLDLAKWGKSTADLQGIFITHNHSDHIKDLKYVSIGGIPIYASQGSLDRDGVQILEVGEGVDIGPFTVLPFSSHHDAPNPLNFIILVEGMKIGYVTDTGEIDEIGLSLLSNCDYYLFESNYEPHLLETSSRPRWLKKRIASGHGHLSNIQCQRYLVSVIGPKTKAVFLSHLSEECNTPEDAMKRIPQLVKKLKEKSTNLRFIPLKQHESIMEELLP